MTARLVTSLKTTRWTWTWSSVVQDPTIDIGGKLVTPHRLPEGREVEVELDGDLAVQVDDGGEGQRQAHIPKLDAGLGRGDRSGLFRASPPGGDVHSRDCEGSIVRDGDVGLLPIEDPEGRVGQYPRLAVGLDQVQKDLRIGKEKIVREGSPTQYRRTHEVKPFLSEKETCRVLVGERDSEVPELGPVYLQDLYLKLYFAAPPVVEVDEPFG